MPIDSTHITLSVSRVLDRWRLGKALPTRKVEWYSHSWARRLSSYDEVPDSYRAFFDALPADQKTPFPYTIVIPGFKGINRRPEPGRLVCTVGDSLHVLEEKDSQFALTSHRVQDICFVESGKILLFSWITIHSIALDVRISSTTLEFNSVTDHIMAPILECVRPVVEADGTDGSMERARLSYLAPVNFKFMSYAQRSIRPGERVIQIIYQPEIRHRLLPLVAPSLSRQVSPAHMCILTDSEVILLQDDASQSWLRGSPHGAILKYVRRKTIDSASVGIAENGLRTFSLHFPGDLRIESLFDAAREAELVQLMHQLGPSTSSPE